MNYKNIKVPFLNNADISNKVELFRKKFWDNSIPVNIERIIDLRLKLDVIPVPSLQKLCDTDALIASSWKEIYVDEEKYLDDRYQNRLRFSLAHEIGHFVLHKNIYESFDIKTFKDIYDLIRDIPQEQYSYLETQANKFANLLLVPRNILGNQRIREVKKQKTIPKNVDRKTLNLYLAIPLSKEFGVSERVIEIALNELEDN